MKREAFTAVGNPLMMGGPVLFVGGDGGGSPPDTSEIVDVRVAGDLPAAAIVNPNFIANAYQRIWDRTAGVWTFGMFFQWGGAAGGVAFFEDASGVVTPVVHGQVLIATPLGLTGAEGMVRFLDANMEPLVRFRVAQQPTLLDSEVDPADGMLVRFSAVGTGAEAFLSVSAGEEFWVAIDNIPVMNKMGAMQQTVHWPQGRGFFLSRWSGDNLGRAYWDGSAWLAGVAPEPPPPPTLEQQMQAFLAGTPGYYLKPDDLTTLFQDTAGTLPVTANGQLIARINAKGGNLTGLNVNQATVASQPSYAAPGRYLGDGVDDIFGAPVPWVFPNMPCYFACFDVELVVLPPGARGITGFSNNQTAFVQLTVNATGQLALAVQNIAAPPISAPVLLAGQRRTVTILCDWTTQGRYEVFVDGVSVTGITLGPTIAPVHSNVNRHRIMSTTANTVAAINAKLGRAVISNKLPTVAERQMIEAWVGEL